MTRDEHLEWAKERAMDYWLKGDLANAVTSMGSDLAKHPELKPPEALIVLGLIHVIDHDADGVKRWIEGWR